MLLREAMAILLDDRSHSEISFGEAILSMIFVRILGGGMILEERRKGTS
jgi:hypothetical protein